MKASTPAERLNIAFRFGSAGIASKSGRMKARYSISADFADFGPDADFETGNEFGERVAPRLRVADLPVEPIDQQRHRRTSPE